MDVGVVVDPWIIPRGEVAAGLSCGRTVREGLGLAMADVTYSRDAAYEHCSGDYLKVHCRLSGDSEVRGEAQEFTQILAGTLTFVTQPLDSLKWERFGANTRGSSITLVCNRAFVNQLFTECEGVLPQIIKDFLDERTRSLVLATLPLPARMRLIVDEMLRGDHRGIVGGMMLEAKALELLCLARQQILKVPPYHGHVRARDVQKVREICELLETNPGMDISARELRRLVAWNKTQMREAFKQITGSTISSYRHNIRMEHARRQLIETNLPITEIAFDAGYEHPSNFATAFRLAFGCSPRTLRGSFH